MITAKVINSIYSIINVHVLHMNDRARADNEDGTAGRYC